MTPKNEIPADAAERPRKAEANARDRAGHSPEDLARRPPEDTPPAIDQVRGMQIETERTRAEEPLRDTNELFSLFMRHSPIYAYIKAVTPTESRVLQASDNFQQMIGVPGADMVGRTMAELFPADLAARMTADDWAVAATGQVLTVDEDLDGRHYTSIKFPIVQGNKTLLAGYTIDVTERVQAEEAVRASEARHRTILRTAMDGFWVVDMDGRLLDVNETYCRMSGYTAEELLALRISDLDATESVADTIAHNEKIRTQGADRFEARHRRKDGTLYDVEVSAQYQPDGGGRCVGFLRDITARKEADAAILHTQSMLENAETAAHLGCYEIDLRTGTAAWSEETFRIFGLDPSSGEPTVGTYQALVHPDDAARLSQLFAECISLGSPFELTYRIVHSSGAIRHVHSIGRVERDPAGAVVRMVGTLQDVTDFKRTEESLRESQERLQAILDNSPLLVYVKDLDGRLTLVNLRFQSLFGMTREQLLGRTSHDLMAQADADVHRGNDLAVMARRAAASFEELNEEPDGRHTYLSTKFPLFNIAGDMTGVCGISADITERKGAEAERARLEAQLQQAQKMESVGRLAGGVAHDFNNMLGVILGHTELALEQVDPAQPIHDDLTEIRAAASRSADLTRQLLAFARKQTVTPKVLDLNETVGSMLSMLRRLIGEDIDLLWVPGANPWPLRVDPSQIDQILANLCVNARDAIAGVGKVTIETANASFDDAYCGTHPGYVPGDYVRLAVSDNGCGMDPDTVSHLFEPFFTTKAMGRGTGLGLATVYGIVKQNRGFVNVYSEPDMGTTFTIYLPRHAGESGRLPAAGAAEPASRGHETILLVEDDPAVLRMTTRMLGGLGYTVLPARSPAEAIRLAGERAAEIHLLMTDVVMPEMNGRDLAAALLALYPRLERLFTSGYTADVIAHHGVLESGVHFLQKPFSVHDLAAKVREALSRD